MDPQTESPAPRARMPVTAAGFVLGALAIGLLGGAVLVRSCTQPPSLPSLPPLSSVETLVRPTPNVLLAVKDLARLESTSFHMERVIDLSEKQSRIFGLIETEDAILLVAVADVSAGVDLGKLGPNDVKVDSLKRTAEVTLPAAEVFHTEIDNSRTYVHTRNTGVLAKRQEKLETQARQEAERALLEAAREAGIAKRASENAKRVVEGLVRSLGYEHVTVHVKD